MHSRSFLHRLSETPRASAAEIDDIERHPLGFADVRASAQPVEDRPRRSIGFVTDPQPRFVTEMSFRRTPAPAVSRGAEVTAPDRADGASSSYGDATEAVVDMPYAGVTDAGPSNEEGVPFYKRELSLRRRKPQETGVVESAELEQDDTVAADDAGSRPVGFEWPSASEAEVVDEPEADAPDEETLVAEPVLVELPSGDVTSDDQKPEEIAAEVVAVSELDEQHDDDDLEVVEVDDADADFAAFDASFPRDDATADEDAPQLAPDLDAPATTDGTEPAIETEASDASDEGATKGRGLVRSGRGAKVATKRSGPKSPRGGGRKVVGLKVGASQLAAAVVTESEGRHQLIGLARTPLEPGIVVDGEVRDADALAQALKSFFAEHNLPRKDVRIGVASNRIGVRTFDIAGIDDQERFDNAVRFKAHEVLPVSVHESVLDYRVVDERVTEGGEVIRRVLLVVAPRDQVEPFLGACGAAGVRLSGIDLEALALLRAFVEPQPFALRTSTDTATVVVAIGHESTSLLVSGGGACEFTRVFDWGGSSLQHAIAQELEITEPEAGAVLQALSLSGSTASSLPPEQAARALDAIRTRLTPFARELVSSLQFYQAQTESLGIGEIVITGGTSHLEGLADALHQMIGVSVRVGDPLQRVTPMVPITPELSAVIGSLAVPIGLAIEDEALRSVNLLPPELRNLGRKKPSLLNVALPVAAVVPFIAIGVLFMNASGDVTDRQGQLETIQAEIAALPEPTRPDIDPTLEVAQQQRAAALASVLGGRLAWDRVLSDLSRVLPANVWLTHFSAKAPIAAPPAVPAATTPAVPGTPVAAVAPTGVAIEGYTYSLPDVARLLARLNALPSLSNVVLGTSAKTKIGKREAVSFTINADIASTGGAQ